MKKLLIALILLGLSCCKKKEEKEEVPPPPVVTPGRSNIMTAKVNGVNWAVKSNQSPDAKIEQGVSAGPPKQYVFMGMTESSLYRNSIWIWTIYATGTVNLRSDGFSAVYFDATGAAFYIKSGTMNISSMDTSHVKSDKCDKFKATFSFTTDSMGGTGYNIDQGSIDFEAK